jgi:hypothetical protein
MRIAATILFALCAIPSCGPTGLDDTCKGPEYSGPRHSMSVEVDMEFWQPGTLSVGGVCTNPSCYDPKFDPKGSLCPSWWFDASGPTGAQCDLTWTLSNGAQCHKTLALPRVTTDCTGMNSSFKLSQLPGDDCTAVDAQ